ncbi:MAG TPA: DinB family protein [Caldilineaceae bacterium]|nr:DinB family protein [Caldilineaceae bacterium]
MSEERVTKKSDLLAHIDRDWTSLTNALAQLSPETMTTICDAQGWTVKDHLIHLYYWERLALYFLQGKPRHEGLDVPEAIYASDDEDVINDMIFQKHRALSLDEALAQLQGLQPEFLAALAPLTDEDLQKPYRHYLPDELGEGNSPPAMNVVYGTSAHHFREHLAWIEALAGEQV